MEVSFDFTESLSLFCLDFLVFFSTELHYIIMSFKFTRQLVFNVPCICEETLLKIMEDVMANYHRKCVQILCGCKTFEHENINHIFGRLPSQCNKPVVINLVSDDDTASDIENEICHNVTVFFLALK